MAFGQAWNVKRRESRLRGRGRGRETNKAREQRRGRIK